MTGAGGRLAKRILSALTPRFELLAFDRRGLDVTDAPAVYDAIGDYAPQVIINCAAWTSVDAAEQHRREALAVNADAVRHLRRAADVVGATLIHFSTNFVFEGAVPRLHTEADKPTPCGAYATSKWLGELAASVSPRAYILRVGPPEHGSAARSIMQALRDGVVPTVTADSVVSASFGADVAQAVRQILEQRPPCGLYNVVNAGVYTWKAFAIEASACLAQEPRYRVVRSSDLGTVAHRPRYAMLSNEKLAQAGITLPSWRTALRREIAA